MKLENKIEKNIEKTKITYDELPYKSKAFSNSLPESQNLIATILGLDTPNIKTARVLEIGCSYGGNILSFAMGNPKAEAIGIDLSEQQIKEGKKLIEFLGLKNIKLYHKNILDFDESFGKFDYIICHGVFSWVPEIVQNKILEIIRKYLVENGTAFISYNTYPGWKKLEVFKDAMLYRVRMFEDMGKNIDVSEKVSYGRGILEFLEQNSSMSDDLKDISKDIREKEEYYLYHEYYEENNRPMYFYDFNKKIEESGLVYVADTSMPLNYPYIGNQTLSDTMDRECGNNHIAKIQYFDFLRNTQFRRSIITHKENKDKINFSDQILIKNLDNLYININKNIKDEVDVETAKNIFKNLSLEYDSEIYTLKIKDFIKKYYKEEEHKDIYKQLFLLAFFENKLTISTEKRKILKEKKIKLNNTHMKMLEYLLKTDYPIVQYSNYSGNGIDLEKNEIEIMLKMFNGEKTDKEIEELLVEINVKPNSSDEEINLKRKEVKTFVNELRYFVERNYLNIKI